MATTISIRVAGKPSAGPGGDGAGGNNGRFGLRAKLAAGVTILGCAAALIFGVARTEDAAQLRPQPTSQTTILLAGTDDLATTGCIGTAGPFGCQAGQSLTGTDDLATSACIGTAGPFACTQGHALAGTDDFGPSGCVQVPGPFACAATLPALTHGTDDLATPACIRTAGPFACGPALIPPAPANFSGEAH